MNYNKVQQKNIAGEDDREKKNERSTRDSLKGGLKGARRSRKGGEEGVVYSVHNSKAECITVNTRKGPARSFSQRSRQLLRLARGINHLSRRCHAYPEDAERATLPYRAW